MNETLNHDPELNTRAQTLKARENFDADDTLFDYGVREGWFTDKFFADWAAGVDLYDA
jgi:hypothetical protein